MISTYISQLKFGQKPVDYQIIDISKEICQESTQKEYSFEEFINSIAQGQTFTLAACFENHARKKVNCKGLQIFAADIDNDNLSYQDIQTKLNNFGVPAAVIYESFSSVPEKRKWRILFIAKHVVTDPAIAMAILRKIKTFFNSDPLIVDVARMLYGTTKDKMAYAEEVYFDPMAVPNLEIETQSFQNAAKALPKSKAFTKKSQQALQMSKNQLRQTNLSRYECIFKSVLLLYNSERFSLKDISIEIQRSIRSLKRFDDYDRTPAQLEYIIDNMLRWVSNQSN